MLIILINKLLLIIMVLSVLNVLRNSYFLIQALISGNKYIINNKSLFILGISISYMITSLMTGILIN